MDFKKKFEMILSILCFGASIFILFYGFTTTLSAYVYYIGLCNLIMGLAIMNEVNS